MTHANWECFRITQKETLYELRCLQHLFLSSVGRNNY